MGALAWLLLAQAAPEPPTVGMPGRLDGIVLPGSALVARPLEDRRTPIVLRIVSTNRHGTAHRYDIVYYGLEPGAYDLRDYLQRADGSSTTDVPAIPVEVRPAYPREERRRVSEVELAPLPMSRGYTAAMVALGALWVAGLVGLLLLGRKRKDLTDPGEGRPPTLADLLRPLVEKAAAGTIVPEEQARLERLLLSFWRRRESLEGLTVVEGLERLRRHAEAGPLLRALEDWLHKPGGAREADIRTLLRPYRELPAEEPAR
jgi:hypothetical protein